MADVEKIRQLFKPDKVSILFIGESAPANDVINRWSKEY